ncbi:hypothetical protein [Alcanivorax sp.]|uniref:hypothetical protein n=1 Tax=Alcanivorax sp. TaxID=1872427 RepID=UPI0032D8DE38
MNTFSIKAAEWNLYTQDSRSGEATAGSNARWAMMKHGYFLFVFLCRCTPQKASFITPFLLGSAHQHA